MNNKLNFTDLTRMILVFMMIFLFGFLYNLEARPEFGTNCNVVITLKSNNVDAMDQHCRTLRSMGVKIHHRFLPKVLIAYVPPTKQKVVSSLSFIQKMNYGYVIYDPQNIERMRGAGYHFWNNYFINPMPPDRPVPDYPPPNDMKIAADKYQYSGKSTEATGPSGKGFSDTSEFFLGDIIVSVIFPESNGSQENWTASQFSNATTYIAQGLDWLKARMVQAETSTNISSDMYIEFSYVDYEVTPTDVEPIDQLTSTHVSPGNFVDDAMVALGYNFGGVLNKVRTYVNDLIDNTGSEEYDWGFTVFVVNDMNDPDHMFPAPEYGFAYAYLGGPLVMMTYNNDGYGPSNMPAVTAHETCHIFYALDEYLSGSTGPGPCDEYSGYLNIQNANSLVPPAYGGTCDQYMNCIMRGQVSPYYSNEMCKYTKWAVGWEDADASGIFDILEFPPDNEFLEVPPDPTADNTPTFRGRAYIDLEDPPPYDVKPNNNPSDPGSDLTTNKIKRDSGAAVEYSYQTGVWYPCIPDDGAFDDVEEYWNITISPPLPAGIYNFTFRVWNSAGLYYDSYYSFEISGSGTPTPTPEVDLEPPEIDTPFPPCESLLWGPCDPDFPKLQPDPGISNSRTVTIGCIIRDATAVDASSIQYRIDINGDNDYNDLPDEDWRYWDSFLAPHEDEQNILCKAEVTYLVDKFGLHFEWKALDIFGPGDDGNGWSYSGKYGYMGIMDDWIVNIDSTPPYILSATALDTSNQGVGIQTGDTVTIVFSGSTNAFLINSANINSVLPLSNNHSWLDSSYNLLGADWKQTSVPNDTLVITLQSTAFFPPSVEIGDVVSTDESSISDIYGNPVVTTTIIKGSFADPMGPDTIYVRVNSQEYQVIVPYGTPEVVLTALFSDLGRGNNNIAAAEYFIDNSTTPVGGGFPMVAEDGAFDSETEVARANIAIPGQWTKDSAHIIYARGQDSAGNWGELHLDKAVTLFYGEYGPDCLTPPVFDGIKSAEQSPEECGGILLTWEEAIDPNDETFSYNVYIAEKSGLENFYSEEGPNIRVTSGKTTTECLVRPVDIPNFELNKKYYFVVRAEDACGNEDVNINELPALTRDNLPPVFLGLQDVDDTISCKTVKLEWNEGSDDQMDCMAKEGEIKYQVFVSNLPNNFDFNQPKAITHDPAGIFLNNLLPNLTHYFIVKAEDQAKDDSGTTTAVTNTKLSDKNQDWMIDQFQDCYLYPNKYRDFKYLIVSNTATSIFVEDGSQMVVPFGAAVGDSYYIDCQGNLDENTEFMVGTPTWESFDSGDDDTIPDEDQIPPYIIDKYPPNNGNPKTGYIDEVSFKILDNCSGVVKESIQLWLNYVNVSNKMLIEPITEIDKDTGELVGGYEVKYYPLDKKLYNLFGEEFVLIVKARDYYWNPILDNDWKITTDSVPNELDDPIIPEPM